jgi:prepilin-type processing-associated H-X9-DG protein
MRGRKGFTVIDLVAVTVLVLIVAVILFPIFARSRDGGGPFSCQSNLKQLGLAFQMYRNDWDDYLPRDAYDWQGRDIGWEQAVFPYTKDWTVYYCPEQPGLRELHKRRIALSDVQSLPFGYGANRAYLFHRAPARAVALSQIKDPSATIVLGDQEAQRRGLFAPVAGAGKTMVPQCNAALRHSEGANVLFADGHVKWMKADDAWSKDDTMWDLK